jgi:LPXTG-motif cell wall-anchored protein
MRRALTLVAAAGVAAAGLAGPSAAAATLPLCSPNDGYIPGQTCEVAVEVDTECVNGRPVLHYAAGSGSVGGAGSVDIRWTNLPGADIVLEDQPLTVQNQPWPAGADASVTLVFATSPASTRVNVQADAACGAALVRSGTGTGTGTASGVTAAASGSRSASGVLAATGSEALSLALGSGALVLGGAALVLARRSRQTGA